MRSQPRIDTTDFGWKANRSLTPQMDLREPIRVEGKGRRKGMNGGEKEGKGRKKTLPPEIIKGYCLDKVIRTALCKKTENVQETIWQRKH